MPAGVLRISPVWTNIHLLSSWPEHHAHGVVQPRNVELRAFVRAGDHDFPLLREDFAKAFGQLVRLCLSSPRPSISSILACHIDPETDRLYAELPKIYSLSSVIEELGIHRALRRLLRRQRDDGRSLLFFRADDFLDSSAPFPTFLLSRGFFRSALEIN